MTAEFILKAECRGGTGAEGRPGSMVGSLTKADFRPGLRQEWCISVEESTPSLSKVKAQISHADRTWQP